MTICTRLWYKNYNYLQFDNWKKILISSHTNNNILQVTVFRDLSILTTPVMFVPLRKKCITVVVVMLQNNNIIESYTGKMQMEK